MIFLPNLGSIKGEIKSFDWNLKNSRINISKEKAVFNAEIQIYNNLIKHYSRCYRQSRYIL